MPSISKVRMIGLLQDELNSLLDFLLDESGTDPDSKRYKFLFEQVDVINHKDPVFQEILNNLVYKGVISEDTRTRIEND